MDKLNYRSCALLIMALVSGMFAGCEMTGASATGSASTDIAMHLQIRHQPAGIPNTAETGHNPASVDFRY